MFSKKYTDLYLGVLLVGAIAGIAFLVSELQFVKSLSLSPLIVGILLGMIYANTIRTKLPTGWTSGIAFCSKRILRIAIILYGFRLTLQSVLELGAMPIVIDALVVLITLGLGILLGRILKIDSDLALLTSTGSAICGAAAVLGAEPIVKAEAHKTAVAVTTVVIFGTLSMFLYPIMFRSGVFNLTLEQWGVYTGATVHEVAHVVGASEPMGEQAATIAILVKMIRVIFLAPVLLIFSFVLSRLRTNPSGEKAKIAVPWFAFGFVGIILLNSVIEHYDLLSVNIIDGINAFDTFLLTMAMTALGMGINFGKFKEAGAKPFLLAFILFIWLVVGGYLLVKLLI